jgi:hypothetical protein
VFADLIVLVADLLPDSLVLVVDFLLVVDLILSDLLLLVLLPDLLLTRCFRFHFFRCPHLVLDRHFMMLVV